MRLRAYGNAIVPPLAAEFIRAYAAEVGLTLVLNWSRPHDHTI